MNSVKMRNDFFTLFMFLTLESQNNRVFTYEECLRLDQAANVKHSRLD